MAPHAERGEPNEIIDVDVHETLPSLMELIPFLAPVWHRHILQYRWDGVHTALPYTVPSVAGTFRSDAKPVDGPPGSDLGLLQKQLLDESSVAIAILDGFFHLSAMGGWFEFGEAVASAYNDWQIGRWLERDPRLRGSVHLVAHDPVAAAREIDRVGSHPQIVQVFLPIVVDRQYGDPHYRPIFEAAVRNQLVVAMHHGPETATALGYPRYYIEWHASIPHAAMCQLASLICNGVLDRFPALRVVVLETGFTWAPHFLWRLDQHHRQLRSEVPWLKRKPSESFREQVRLGTQPLEDLDARRFEQVIDMIGSDDILMFASDYPHWDADSPRLGLPGGLSETTRERILSKNARATYARL
jgi:predicted TIM-barrel fold metal-dependent hydrolase